MNGNIETIVVHRQNVKKFNLRDKEFDFTTIADKLKLAQYLKRQSKDGFVIESVYMYRTYVSVWISNADCVKVPKTPCSQETIMDEDKNEIFVGIRHNNQRLECATRAIPETVETVEIEPETVEIEEIPEFVPFDNFYPKNEPFPETEEIVRFRVKSNGKTMLFDYIEDAEEWAKILDFFGHPWFLYEDDCYPSGGCLSVLIADFKHGRY